MGREFNPHRAHHFNMKEINLYTTAGDKTLSFKFNNPGFVYNETQKWVSISATGRTFTLNTPFLAFDEEIEQNGIVPDFGAMTHSQINDAYVSKGKVIIIFTSIGIPIRMFYGDKIRFVEEKGGLNYFQVDDKELWFFGMNFLILSKNK